MLTFAVKLLIYCRLAADVWRRCSVAVVVGRWLCRPDVEAGGRGGGGPLIRSNFKKKITYIFFWAGGQKMRTLR